MICKILKFFFIKISIYIKSRMDLNFTIAKKIYSGSKKKTSLPQSLAHSLPSECENRSPKWVCRMSC